jgi:PKD repeat protein
MSHELSETITDPDGDAWVDGSGNEIGDLCITTFGKAIGGSGSRRYNETIAGGHFYLQEEWSNATDRCEPRAKPDRASFAVTERTGATLTFKAAARDPNASGQIVSYRWDFGGGAIATGRTVTHQFPASGRYTVKLRVTDSWDNWGYYTRAVPVA